MRDTDPLRALELCSPRFPTSKPFPTVAPIRPDWLVPQPINRGAKRPRPAGSSCSSALPQDVQDEVRRLVQDAMQQHGFKLPEEEAVAPPQLATIKAMDAGFLAAGHFFCKAAGAYHTSSTSFFMLWPDGRLTQKCHNTGCGGKRHDCGVWPLPPAIAAFLKGGAKAEAKGKGKGKGKGKARTTE